MHWVLELFDSIQTKKDKRGFWKMMMMMTMMKRMLKYCDRGLFFDLYSFIIFFFSIVKQESSIYVGMMGGQSLQLVIWVTQMNYDSIIKKNNLLSRGM